MDKLKRRIRDRAFLALIYKTLRSPVQTTDEAGKKHLAASRLGVPQGNVLSPVLANVYLNDFCLTIAGRTPCKIVTYADDFQGMDPGVEVASDSRSGGTYVYYSLAVLKEDSDPENPQWDAISAACRLPSLP